MPVTSSSLALSCPMDQDGVMRRSEPEFSEVTWIGISAGVRRLMLENEALLDGVLEQD